MYIWHVLEFFFTLQESGLWRWNDVNDNKKIPKSEVDQQDIQR